MGSALARKNGLRWIAFELGNGQQQVLGRNVLVFKVVGFFERAIEELVEGWRHGRLGSRP